MAYKMKKGGFSHLGAFHRGGGTELTVIARREGGLSVIFYDRESKKKLLEARLAEGMSVGRVYSVFFPELGGNLCYLLCDRDGVYLDPYAPVICGREKWNDIRRKEEDFAVYGCVGELGEYFSHIYDSSDRTSTASAPYSGDSCPCELVPSVKPEDMVIYKLHLRGFTSANGLAASYKGSYRGIIKKLPYLKELGVTSILFMPIYEFEEIRFHTYRVYEASRGKGRVTSDPFGINYWGYGDASYFAPKASYFGADPQKGMEEMVAAIHREGMEVLMELSFTEERVISDSRLIADILLWWHLRYRVDGFRLMGDGLPMDYILRHPKLSNVKLLCDQADKRLLEKEEHKRFFFYSDDFVYPLRKLENHMDGSAAFLADQMRRQGEKYGFVNYAAEKSGFTLLDAYSYGEKHNEANGEDNRDGSNYNCSANHGCEGKTNSRNVNEKRYTCIRSDLAILFLSQSVPLICEGDEALNSAEGNNNPYGQDNPVGWPVFSSKKDARLLQEFVSQLARFRREHPAIRSGMPMKQSDYICCGLPDLSYHDSEPWIMGIGAEKKGLGILYAGAYAGEDEEDVMVVMNFYYDDRSYALPRLMKKRRWFLCANTREAVFYEKPIPCEKDEIMVPGGSVSILAGR